MTAAVELRVRVPPPGGGAAVLKRADKGAGIQEEREKEEDREDAHGWRSFSHEEGEEQ